MQPTCRQVPPRNPSFSMTRVFNPHCEARIAVLYPPGPLPIIARSYLAKCPPRLAGAPLTSHELRRVRSREPMPLDEVEVQPASALSPGLPQTNRGGPRICRGLLRMIHASILTAAQTRRNTGKVGQTSVCRTYGGAAN